MIHDTADPTIKGAGYEGLRLGGARIEYASADVLPPNVLPVPRPDARSDLDDWPPDHHQPLGGRAPVREGPYLG